MTATSEALPDVLKHLRHNIVASMGDGAFWMLGSGLVDLNNVLPVLAIAMLGETPGKQFIPFIPLANLIILFGSLLTAALAEQRQRHLPLMLAVGVMQRVPLLLAAMALWWFGLDFPVAVFWFVIAMLVVLYLAIGLMVNPWNELFLKQFPVNWRSTVLSFRGLTGQLLTFFVGSQIVKALLDTGAASGAPSARQFGGLYFLCFAFMTVGYIFLAFQREPHSPPRPNPAQGLFGFLAKTPRLLKEDRYFLRYFLVSCLGLGWIPVLPQVALYIKDQLEQPAEFIGYVIASGAAGAVVGSLVAGRLGDRYGGRTCLFWGRLTGLIALGGLAMAPNQAVYLTMAGLIATAQQLLSVGDYAYLTEMAPVDERPTYLAIYRLLAVSIVLSGVALGKLWEHSHWPIQGLIAVGAGSMSLCLLFTLFLSEPRHETAPT